MKGKLTPIKLDSYKPLREIVFEALRDAIINGVLAPGERLMEVQMAEELGVSRTPVREAIRKLELEGYVMLLPRKGAYVADFSSKSIVDVLEVRGVLEALAAGLAAERITDQELDSLERLLVRASECAQNSDLDRLIEVDTEFHDVLYKASRNDRLAQIVANIREQIQRFRATSLAFPGRMQRAVEEHKQIVDAIAERDTARAKRLAQQHIENSEDSILEGVRKIKAGEKTQKDGKG